ncbi:MAG: hypothetical protein MRY21_04265, partial [Simkaniaceae bacterium]|nr:hypothetical protein [Simkaniaceae bacterium]
PREAPQNPNINFLQTLKNPKFTLFALVQASGFSLFSLFCCSSPYFFINLLEMTKYQFGVAFSGVILSQLLGSLVAKMIHRKSGTEALLVLGITTLFITGLAMLFGYLAVGLTVKSILIPVSLLTFAVAFLTHAGRVGALAEEIKATRMLRAMSYLTAAFIGSIFMQFEVSSLIPFSTLIVALSLITLLGSYYTLQKDETTQST